MLKQQIQSDATTSLKSGDSLVLSTLRMLLASIFIREKEKRYKISKARSDLKEEQLQKESELTDEEITETVSSEIKKRKDAIVLYEKGNRPELANKEKKESQILKKYLPEQLSEEELKKIIEESIAKVGIKVPSAPFGTAQGKRSGQVMGKVMADLNPKIRGRADGGEVSKIVKEILLRN